MSAVTITFLRFQRSVRAPEKSPNTRYGAASQAATSAVRLGEPLVRYTMIGRVMRVTMLPAPDSTRETK
jgi:hypothetical protein